MAYDNRAVDEVDVSAVFAASDGQPALFLQVAAWGRLLTRIGIRLTAQKHVLIISFASAPLLLLFVQPGHYRPLSAFWAVWLALCDTLVIYFSWHAWNRAIEIYPTLNEMLAITPVVERRRLRSAYVKRLGPLRQVMVGVCCAVAVPVVAFSLPEALVERVPVTVASLALSGYIVGHALYFVIGSVTFCERISRVSRVQVRWNDPMRTPGMDNLSKTMQLQARLGVVLFLPLAVPFTYAYLQLNNAFMRTVYLAGLAIPSVSIAVVGLATQHWLAQPIMREKRRILGRLSEEIDLMRSERRMPRSEGPTMASIKERIEIYSLISATSDSYLRSDVVTQYATTTLAALLPLAIAFLAG